ncbi:MAG: hypothetical protein ACHP7K_09145 [Actinomycetales bacterium]
MTIVLLGLTACSSAERPVPAAAADSNRATPVASADAQPARSFRAPTFLAAAGDVGTDETLLFEAGSQTQSATYGPVVTEAKTVVYLRCAGSGSMSFRMKDVGSLVMPCEENGAPHGTRNVFDTRWANNPTFSVASAPGQIWSIGVYDEPVP